MKGLFVKDIELMKQQKQFFILVIVMGVILNLAGSGSISFATGYFTFVTAIFAIIDDNATNVKAMKYLIEHYFDNFKVDSIEIIGSGYDSVAYLVNNIPDNLYPIIGVPDPIYSITLDGKLYFVKLCVSFLGLTKISTSFCS